MGVLSIILIDDKKRLLRLLSDIKKIRPNTNNVF